MKAARRHVKLLSVCSGIVATLGTLSSSAWALQPLSEFLAGARQNSFAAREQTVSVEQKRSEEKVAFGRLLPSLTVKGQYTYNQYEAEVTVPGAATSIVITPHNQLDGFAILDVPIVDLASRARHDQAELLMEVAQLQGELVGVELDRAVARLYAQYIGASALLNAAQESVALAQKNYEFVQTRVSLGAGTELDRVRALANVERAKQDQAEANLARTLYARQLNTLTGVEASAVTELPEDALLPEAPLEQWLGVGNTPSDKMAAKLVDVTNAGRRASQYAMLPTLSANAQERLTNATGFAGQASSYTLQAVLTWRLDYATYAQREAQDAALALQRVRNEKTRRDMEDQIFEAYQRIQSGIVKSTSARAQVAAAKQAASLASERYQAGAATQLDVTQSLRDSFLSSAAQIQADADLSFARALLRINAGQPPSPPGSSSGPAPTP